ncbi:MAG: hydrogenase maturation protease [Pseudomonadota bacterium]
MAGVGNVLRADDGFGPRAASLIGNEELPDGVVVLETGIGGIHLVQELMKGYDALVLLDACDRGAEPGTLFTLEPEVLDPQSMSDRERRDYFADVHYATPVRALTMSRAVGVLPPLVRVIGCQVADATAFCEAMDSRVEQATADAVPLVLDLIAALQRGKAA